MGDFIMINPQIGSENKTYQAFELNSDNSLLPNFFKDTFIENGFLWSSQDLSSLNCVKTETSCPIDVFPILEIGSLESAKLIAEISFEFSEVKYFLASPLTCNLNNYKETENIYTNRYGIIPLGSRIESNIAPYKAKIGYSWVMCSWILQILIWIQLKWNSFLKKKRKTVGDWVVY